MKPRFSIIFVMTLVLTVSLAIRGWKFIFPDTNKNQITLDVTGKIENHLPSNTVIKLLQDPEHARTIEREFAVTELPVSLPNYLQKSGFVAEFWAPNKNGAQQRLFSVVVEPNFFWGSETGVITLKLDKPEPELMPFRYWALLAWCPRISAKMRYRELPWLDPTTKLLAPIPDLPEMTVTKSSNGETIERFTLEYERKELNYLWGKFAAKEDPVLDHGEELIFTVYYDSGGLFDPISTQCGLKYDKNRHKF